jgi:hypothetical protein
VNVATENRGFADNPYASIQPCVTTKMHTGDRVSLQSWVTLSWDKPILG